MPPKQKTVDDKPRRRLRLPEPSCWSRPPDGALYLDWCKNPKDPDGLLDGSKGARECRSMPIGRGINFVKIVEIINAHDRDEGVTDAKRYPQSPAYAPLTWQDITRFNWGTAEPEEVNWYLWWYLESFLERTHDHKNYRFTADPGDVGAIIEFHRTHHFQFIWVPVAVRPPEPRAVAGTRRKIVVDKEGCGYRKSAKCTRGVRTSATPDVQCSVSTKLTSRSPAKPDPNPTVTLPGETPDQAVVKELQKIDDVLITVTRTRVYRAMAMKEGCTPLFSPISFERLTEIVFHYMAHRRVDDSDVAYTPSRTPAPAAAFPAHKNHPLGNYLGVPGRDELGAVAKSIRDLSTLGLLERITLRGYEDRTTDRSKEDRETFTQERARWVFDALVQEFNLPLRVERPGDKADSTLAGTIPVHIIGCGAGDAKYQRRNDAHRVVMVDYETRAKPQRPAIAEEQRIRAWTLYEIFYHPLKKAAAPTAAELQDRRDVAFRPDSVDPISGTLFHSGPDQAVANDNIDAVHFYREMQPYLLLFFDLVPKKYREAIWQLLKESATWKADNSIAVKALFPRKLPKLTPKYWSETGQMTPKVRVAEWEGTATYLAQYFSEVCASQPWLDADENAEPNHKRVLEAPPFQLSFAPDLAEVVPMIVGTDYKVTNRVHFR